MLLTESRYKFYRKYNKNTIAKLKVTSALPILCKLEVRNKVQISLINLNHIVSPVHKQSCNNMILILVQHLFSILHAIFTKVFKSRNFLLYSQNEHRMKLHLTHKYQQEHQPPSFSSLFLLIHNCVTRIFSAKNMQEIAVCICILGLTVGVFTGKTKFEHHTYTLINFKI